MTNIHESLSWLGVPPIITTDEKDKVFLRLAYGYANSHSPDPSTKNGAIIVDSLGETITFAVNRFPPGIAETPKRLNDRQTKYKLVVHAEAGAILSAVYHGKMIRNSTLYCPFYSCGECAKSIIASRGIKRIVGHAQMMSLASGHDAWTNTITDGWKMLDEAGIQCYLFDGHLGMLARFNYQDIVL
jgi:dCMP deaminase